MSHWQELKEHLSLVEDIRHAEKDVMEVQERILTEDDKGPGGSFGLKPRNVNNYFLLCPQMFTDKNEDVEHESEQISTKTHPSVAPNTYLR